MTAAGESLDTALARHADGRLDDAGLALALADADVVLAVARAGEEGTVDPFVFTADGRDYAAAFSSIDRFRSFAAGTPFVRVAVRALAANWPDGLGLVVNPASEPSVTMDSRQVRSLAAMRAGGNRVEPAGTGVRVGAPEPGLPADAVAVLRSCVAASADVTAAYPLAWAAGDDRPRLVIGLRLVADAADGAVPRFAADAAAREPRFGSLDFVELRGRLLSSAQQQVEPVV
jgi:hypothetical protein